jgi:hypothetical protein
MLFLQKCYEFTAYFYNLNTKSIVFCRHLQPRHKKFGNLSPFTTLNVRMYGEVFAFYGRKFLLFTTVNFPSGPVHMHLRPQRC